MKEKHNSEKIAEDMVAIGPEKRSLWMNFIIPDEDAMKAEATGEKPLLKGLSLHQHCDYPTITEEGIEEKFTCSIVVLDINQVIQLRDVLNGMVITDLEGNRIEE